MLLRHIVEFAPYY